MRIELRELPLIAITFGETISDDEWTEYHRVVLGQLDKKGPVLLLNNHLSGGLPNAAQRAYNANIQQKYPLLFSRGILGSAIVTRSSLVRGVLTALSWMVRPSFPVKVFKTVREGRGWLEERRAIGFEEAPRWDTD